MEKVLVFASRNFASVDDVADFLDDAGPNYRLDKIVNNADGTVTAKIDCLLSGVELAEDVFGIGFSLINVRQYNYNKKTFRRNRNGSSIKRTATVVRN